MTLAFKKVPAVINWRTSPGNILFDYINDVIFLKSCVTFIHIKMLNLDVFDLITSNNKGKSILQLCIVVLNHTKGHKNNTLIFGKIISVRGSVVDVWFENNLPSIYTLLHTGKDNQIAIEVLTQLDVHRVRGIALTPTQGLARGMVVETDGKELKVPVGKKIMGRMFDVFGNTIDHQKPLSRGRVA